MVWVKTFFVFLGSFVPWKLTENILMKAQICYNKRRFHILETVKHCYGK